MKHIIKSLKQHFCKHTYTRTTEWFDRENKVLRSETICMDCKKRVPEKNTSGTAYMERMNRFIAHINQLEQNSGPPPPANKEQE